MSTTGAVRAPRWFMVITIVALVWNLLGIVAYLMQVMMTHEALAALPEAQRMLYQDVPSWAIAAFAIAVHAGALGCLLLVLRKSLAVAVLWLSLIGALVQMYHSFFVANALEVLGPGGLVMPVLVIVVAIYLVVLARSAKGRGWLN